MTAQMMYKRVTNLLVSRGWVRSKVVLKYDIFTAPDSIRLSNDYKLFVYNQYNDSNYAKEITPVLNIISKIYKEDIDKLINKLVNKYI